MTAVKSRITARGKVERMGSNQFNVLVENGERYRAEFKQAGCGTSETWAGENPLRVTISRKKWVSQLHPGDEVEYVLEPVRRKDKNSPTGFKVGTRGVSMTIVSRAGQ